MHGFFFNMLIFLYGIVFHRKLKVKNDISLGKFHFLMFIFSQWYLLRLHIILDPAIVAILFSICIYITMFSLLQIQYQPLKEGYFNLKNGIHVFLKYYLHEILFVY